MKNYLTASLTGMALLCAASVLTIVAACGSDESSTIDPNTEAGASSSGASSSGASSSGGSSSGTTSSSGTASSSGTSGSSGSDGGGGDDAGFDGGDAANTTCATLTKAQCRQCCGAGHTDGRQAYDSAYKTCVCTQAHCQSACSQSVCASPSNPGESTACTNCLGDLTKAGGDCEQSKVQAQTACTANADCAAYLTCLGGCP